MLLKAPLADASFDLFVDLWQANGVEKMDAVLKSPHDAKLNPNFGQNVAGKDGPNCTPKSLPHKE